MPNIYYNGCRIYFWSNENDEPIHVHVTEGEVSKNSVKIFIRSNNTLDIDYCGYSIRKSTIDKAVDFINSNIMLIKTRWCEHFRVNFSDIKYMD